jgi:hypothetical protein
MELPKPHIIDSNRPQHHAVSTQLNRAGRHGKHRDSTIREQTPGLMPILLLLAVEFL